MKSMNCIYTEQIFIIKDIGNMIRYFAVRMEKYFKMKHIEAKVDLT